MSSLEEQARKKRNRKAKSIAASLEQFGDEGLVLVASVVDFEDIEDSLFYCLEHEDLSEEARVSMQRLRKRIHEKLQNHRRNQVDSAA